MNPELKAAERAGKADTGTESLCGGSHGKEFNVLCLAEGLRKRSREVECMPVLRW